MTRATHAVAAGLLAGALIRERWRHVAMRLTAILVFAIGLGAARGWVGLTIGGAAPALAPVAVATYCALLISCLVSLIAFFVLRGNVERDRRSRVLDVLAATPLGTGQYVMAQFVANVVVSGGLLALVAAGALLVPGGDGWGTPAAMADAAVTLLLVALPALVFVAGLVVLLDAAPFTAGAAGNIVFMLAWIALLANSFDPMGLDLMGVGVVLSSLREHTAALVPPVSNDVALFVDIPAPHRSYDWTGVTWNGPTVVRRMLWIFAGCAAAAAAIPVLGRLEDGVRISHRRLSRVSPPASPKAGSDAVLPTTALAGELRLLRRDLRWWHLLALAISGVAGLTQDPRVAMERVLPFAWLWPVALLASVAGREFTSGVDQLLIAGRRASLRRLLAAWGAGALVMAAAGFGVFVRVLLAGEAAWALAWLAGTAFAPALGLFLSHLSRSRRLFEAVFVLLCFFGPIRGNATLDFAGATLARGGNPPLGVLLLLTLGMMVFVMSQRWTFPRLLRRHPR